MKPNHYLQLYIHIVFTVKFRECLFNREQLQIICKYISGIITNERHKSIIVGGYRDHIHVLLGLNPVISVSDIVMNIKRSSSIFINQKKWFPGNFQWQEGYGAFSFNRNDMSRMYDYVLRQEEHHQDRTFREEYIGLLKENEIDYDDKYLIEFFD